jgi:hypothetical protein
MIWISLAAIVWAVWIYHKAGQPKPDIDQALKDLKDAYHPFEDEDKH